MIETPRRRTVNVDRARDRNATKLAAPFRADLGRWHLRIAQLRGFAVLPSRRPVKPDLLVEADQLASLIRDAQTRFDATLTDSPPEIVSNSRFQDMYKALRQAASSLAQVRHELEISALRRPPADATERALSHDAGAFASGDHSASQRETGDRQEA